MYILGFLAQIANNFEKIDLHVSHVSHAGLSYGDTNFVFEFALAGNIRSGKKEILKASKENICTVL